MRIEAPTLQEAFSKAAEQLNCSVTEIDVKSVIQHPSAGFLGFFKKNAIIEVEVEKGKARAKRENRNDEHKKDQNFDKKQDEHRENRADKRDDKRRNKNKKSKNHQQNTPKQSLSEKNESLTQSAFGDNAQSANDEPKPEYVIKRLDSAEIKPQKHEQKDILDTSIIDNFNIDDDSSKNNTKDEKKPKEPIKFDEILPVIKEDLTRLLNASCFNITKIEVSKFSDDCVLVELDGEDAALLIGKEGYRYKAISYLLHNWLNPKYNLIVRLEIAEFLKNQEAMIEQYLVSIIERVQNTGKAQTKPLDGVLVKIALEKLRAKFPEKYVGIKSNGSDRFVVVNDFFKK
ncbi:Jag N-terminal domain-containing protein [Campylobacter mucosalis]|uniref:Jag N-terminal domain-containing protein n=1 Tax=Campylobacter mucosalis TaxID=202 RepID=UPI0014707C12|nr:Jag N-terminal domain-containing protein [Campylobacter mucosalis]